MSGFVQDEIYLTAKNEITTVKSDFKCTKNRELSTGYGLCYDCQDAKNNQKQLNLNLHVPSSLKSSSNRNYVYASKEHADYLIGDFKNGKPYNGFFKEDGASLGWMIYSYYENGQLVEQLYNDLHNTLMAGEDSELAYTRLDAKSTFAGGKLVNGIEITPIDLKGGSAEVTHAVKNSKTDHFVLGLFAVHYGEFIKITQVQTGYLLQSSLGSSLKVTFSEKGRKIEVLDSQGKTESETEYVHYALTESSKVDIKRYYSYLQKGNQLYIEQIRNTQQLSEDEEQEEYDESSSYINRVAQNLYTPEPLEVSFFESILHENVRGIKNFFGSYGYYEGKVYGFVYKAGSTAGTYSLDYYVDGRVDGPAQLKIRDKTLPEIAKVLATVWAEEEEQEDESDR